MNVGVEWLVEAAGCSFEALRDRLLIERTCQRILAELDLHVVGTGQVQKFPEPGGITALYLLTESHLACHTYPEHGVATFNLYCCRLRPHWPWESRLAECLGATSVTVRRLARGTDQLAESATQDVDATDLRPDESFSYTGGSRD